MGSRITFEEAKKRILELHNNRIEILEYTAIGKKAKFKCTNCGNVWETEAASVINKGRGCNNCVDRKHRGRFTPQEVREFIISQNCEWIYGEFVDGESYLSIKFDCGHTGDIRFKYFWKGSRCKKCAREKSIINNRNKEIDVIKFVEEKGFKFLEFPNGYKNSKSIIRYACELGHINDKQYTIFRRDFYCSVCQKSEHLNKQKSILKYAILKIESRGCKYISGDYLNEDSELLIEFVCGHQVYVPFYFFRSRKYDLCPDCVEKEKRFNRRTPENEIIKIIEKEGYVFESFPNGYKGNVSKVKYRCVYGHESIVSVAFFLNKRYCKECKRIEKSNNKKGINNIFWKGGISKITRQFRGLIKDWYKESLIHFNYTCQITGRKARTIHHLYPFWKIVEETFDSLGIPRKESLSDYSSEELEIIDKRFIEIHNSHGYGIPLVSSVHRLFHKIYSTTDFSEQDFTDFQHRIASGEIILPN